MEAGLGVLDEGDQLGLRVQSSPCCAWSQSRASTFGSPCMHPYLCDQIETRALLSLRSPAELWYRFSVVPTVLRECDQEYTF